MRTEAKFPSEISSVIICTTCYVVAKIT